MENSVFVRSSEMPAPVEALREWHLRPGAFAKLTPPWEEARVIESPEPLRDGARAVIEVPLGPFRQRWVALHELTEWGFIDRQAEGPFAKWEHRHRFEAIDERRSRLTDEILYRLPFGWLGRLAGSRFVERKLDRLFRFRHEATAAALRAEVEGSSASPEK